MLIREFASKNKAYFLKEIQSVISVFYLALVGIGMLFEFQKYRAFNINIFQYADVFDFLIAPFRDTKIFVFVFGTFVLMYVLVKLDSLILAKFPKLYSWLLLGINRKYWVSYYRAISVAFVFVVYIFLSSLLLAKSNKKNILNNPGEIKITFADNQVLSGKLIGKTKETVFLFSSGEIKIIPTIAVVKTIEID